MMKPGRRWVFLAFWTSVAAWTGFTGVCAQDFDDRTVTHIEYPAWFMDTPFLHLDEALAEAESRGRKGLMVLFTSEGCSYCDAFIRRSLGDPDIAEHVQSNFDSVGLEIFDDREMVDPHGQSLAVKDFAKREGAGFSPTVVFYGVDGRRILRLVGYQSPPRFRAILGYLAEESPGSLRDHLEGIANREASGQAAVGLRSDPLFASPPYALDRSVFPASRPLLVLFEKPGCTECGEFHTGVLALDEVRDVLQHFDVVRLDATDERTPVLGPDGRRWTPASWFRGTGFTRVPALLFFDERGEAVLETDALVRRQRMMNSMNYVLDRAYEKDWTYQRYARSRAIKRNQRSTGDP